MSQQQLQPSGSSDHSVEVQLAAGASLIADVGEGLPKKAVAKGNVSTRSKAELRAERRALQEAQRAAKTANKQVGGQKQKETSAIKQDSATSKKLVPTILQSSSSNANRGETISVAGNKDMKVHGPDRQTRKLDKQRVPFRQCHGQKKVCLFRHLVQYERDTCLTYGLEFDSSAIHPAIIKLGVQYMEGVISGSNARCISLLNAFKEVITDYRMPSNAEISRDLEIHIRPDISFLNQCRPLSVSMGNAIKYLKSQIMHISSSLTAEQAKKMLIDGIDKFVEEKILYAVKAISEDACHKICDGDVILVYSGSSLIKRLLCDAHKQGKMFSVIVADGRPKREGCQMLHNLVSSGIKCAYILINSLSFVMKEVTKVFLSAHALLANGFVTSQIGSSQVALVAKSYNIPVLVCCETYKFCDRVQTDSFVFNELGDPRDLMGFQDITKNDMLTAWKDISGFNVLNLVYDVTPPELISLVITELGMIPCTSVPVVLRVKCAES